MILRLLLIGPPGAGKGALAARLLMRCATCSLIATGDYFRAQVSRDTALGRQIASFVSEGRLIPDDVVIREIETRSGAGELDHGFILDGFPRTTAQADALTRILDVRGHGGVQAAVQMRVARQLILERLSGRRVCRACGSIYNVRTMPPRTAERCDRCGHAIILRADDAPETVLRRLDVFDAQTQPVVDYYRQKGLIAVVDGAMNPEEAAIQVLKSLGDSAQ